MKTWEQWAVQEARIRFLWEKLVDRSLSKYGFPKNWPNYTSGVINPDFPERVKDRLRLLVKCGTLARDRAIQARPKFHQEVKHRMRVGDLFRNTFKELSREYRNQLRRVP